MALPFLKNKQQSVAGLIMKHRAPDGIKDDMPEEPSDNQGLHSAASDLMNAVHAKDIPAIAAAMKAAFEIMQSEPSQEDDNSFDSQNEKAAE